MENAVAEKKTELSTEKMPIGKKTGKKWKWILLALIVLIAAALVLRGVLGGKKRGTDQTEYETAEVEKRTIESSLSGSGTLQPANSYTVTTLVSGEILADTFQEGDVVEEGALLYQIDSSDASNNIEKSQISLAQAQRSYNTAADSRYVRAAVSGQVYELYVSVGDEVRQGQQIALVRDSATMLLTVPFPADDAVGFYAGQEASVTLDGSFETLTGTVKSVSGSDRVGVGNMITRNVTVAVPNPGGISDTQAATASIGGVGCSANATFTYNAENAVNASASGTVVSVDAPEGAMVGKDQIIVTLGGDELSDSIQRAADSLRNAELSMDSQRNQLDNYTVTSPIYGTIVEKIAKAGDKVGGSGNSGNNTLCIIYDLSYLEMTMDIDELDISKVSAGQKVQITADAVEGKTYEGVITKVSVVGTTSNGATFYPSTVRIDETEGLRPGMNVDAEIVTERAEDTLAIPGAALSRGNLVLITKDSPSAANAAEREAPEGYVYVKVRTGVSDDDYIEITEGLQLGDTVAYRRSKASASDNNMGGFGMMGMGGAPGGYGGNGGNRGGNGGNRSGNGSGGNRGNRS